MHAGDLEKLEQQAPFLPPDADDIDLTSDSTFETGPNRTWPTWPTIISGFLFVASLVIILVSALIPPTDSQCVRAMHAWSPMLEALEYHQSDDAYQSRGLYMGQPTDVLEDAWEVFWKGGSLGIPEDKLPLFNKSSNERDWHHLPDDVGGGIQAFFEGFHDLHCLNLVRQYTYRNDWNYTNHFFTSERIPVLFHAEHCLEMLRAKLMCDADTTPYLIVNDPERGEVVDVRTRRTCHNIPAIRQWTKEHIVVLDT